MRKVLSIVGDPLFWLRDLPGRQQVYDLMRFASQDLGDFAKKIVLFHIASLLCIQRKCVLRRKFLLVTILHIICLSYKRMMVG